MWWLLVWFSCSLPLSLEELYVPPAVHVFWVLLWNCFCCYMVNHTLWILECSLQWPPCWSRCQSMLYFFKYYITLYFPDGFLYNCCVQLQGYWQIFFDTGNFTEYWEDHFTNLLQNASFCFLTFVPWGTKVRSRVQTACEGWSICSVLVFVEKCDITCFDLFEKDSAIPVSWAIIPARVLAIEGAHKHKILAVWHVKMISLNSPSQYYRFTKEKR